MNRSSRTLARGAAVVLLAGVLAGMSACATARTGELEPRYVAVHNALASLGLVQIGPIHQGSLAEGREVRLRVELPAQCTTAVVLGGAGVRDVDAMLLDPDDKPVARDATRDAEATLRACPEVPGRYTLVVKMTAGAGDFVAATWAGSGSPAPAAGPVSSAALAQTGSGTCEAPFVAGPGTLTGNTRRGSSEHTGTCASSDSNEVVYKLEVPRRQRVSVEVDPQFDSVVYVRQDECAESAGEVACNDDASSPQKRGNSNRGSRVDVVLEAGTYFVFVDGYGNDGGPFRMNVQMTDVPPLADACRQLRSLPNGVVSGSLAGAFDNVHATCGSDAKGPDVLFKYDLLARSRVRIKATSKDYNPVVHVRKQCTDDRSEVGCSDSGLASDDAAFVQVLDAGSYVVAADSSAPDAAGAYTLEAASTTEVGAGIRGDGCSDAVLLGAAEKVVGDTFDAKDDLSGRCGGQGAPDAVYRFELTRRSRVTARMTASEAREVFVVRRSCTEAASEVACGNAIDEVLGPGVYTLAVDGASPTAFGRFTFDWKVRDVSAQEAACKGAPLLVDGRGVQGSTTGAGDKFTTSCGGREETQASPDRMFKIVVAAKTRVRLALATPTWDGVLSLRKSCLDPPNARNARAAEVACNNDDADNKHAKIETLLEPGTYFVLVDGHQAKNEGPFTLDYKTLR